MFKKATAALAMIAAMSTLVSAEVFFDTLNKTNLQDEISAMELSVPQPATAAEKAATDKEWTIMVFINAKNN